MTGSHGHFAWYELSTSDVEAATAFYTKVMGWGVHDASLPGMTYVLFSAGNAVVSGVMELPVRAGETGGRPCWVGYVEVENVDAAADRIKQLGGAVHIAPTDIPGIGRFAVFADPQAATLAVLTSLAPDQGRRAAVGGAGRVGWHELFAADRETAFAFYGELFGWQRAESHAGDAVTYQLFSAGGHTIGGMLTKPAAMPDPFWLYYFNIDNVGAAAQRVQAAGGQILDGPFEVPGDSWVVQCADPQGAVFALKGRRGPIGYFERVARGNPSGPRGRWSW